MDLPREQCSGDTQQTGLQLDTNSKTEDASQSLVKMDTERVNSVGSIGKEGFASISNQNILEMEEDIGESQLATKNSVLDSQETKLELVAGNENVNEPESVDIAADGMELEIQSSSYNSEQSSGLNESSLDENKAGKKPTSSMSNDDSNPCGEIIAKNSALEIVGVGDVEEASSSTQAVADSQESDESAAKGNVSALAEPTVLCNSNALNALWGYGILISSDESSDEEEPSLVSVRDTATQRQSVPSLDSDSSMSSSTSLFFTDDSGSDDEQASGEKNMPNARPKKPLMTEGELEFEDLPPIEDLHITVPEHDCIKVGEVLHVVDKLVIVQGIKNMPPLDLESVLFLSWDRPLGLIFDVIGPVCQPSYCVRFNSNEEIKSKNITPGMPVYFGRKSQFTKYVFMKHLLSCKGSDASWTGNNEPPPEQLDFSDDETERATKKAIKAINKEMKVDPDEPQRKKHMAYEQRMNAMNSYMNRVSELKSQVQQRKRRPPRKEPTCARLIHPAVLSSAVTAPMFHPQQQPPPYQGSLPSPPFDAPCSMLAFNSLVPPPPPTALPKPSMFVDTSRPPPPPHTPQPPLHNHLTFPPPNMSVPPPPPSTTTSSLFCNINLPPPPQPAAVASSRLFRANNSVNLNSLFPDLFMNSRTHASPITAMVAQQQQHGSSRVTNPVSFSFPPPPTFTPTSSAPQPLKDGAAAAADANRFIPSAAFHRPPSPTPPPYSLFINKT